MTEPIRARHVPVGRAFIVLAGIGLLVTTYFVSIAIPVGGCVTDTPGVECAPVDPRATFLPIAVPLGVFVSLALVALGLMQRRRES